MRKGPRIRPLSLLSLLSLLSNRENETRALVLQRRNAPDAIRERPSRNWVARRCFLFLRILLVPLLPPRSAFLRLFFLWTTSSLFEEQKVSVTRYRAIRLRVRLDG